MRAVLQRVSEASVIADGELTGSIGPGLLILVGVSTEDSGEDAEWLCRKICNLRIFNDSSGLMNLSIRDTGGRMLVISQFTLFAQTKKGNRPSYIRAARPEQAIPLYEQFIRLLELESNSIVETGRFGADMKVSLANDGPVTILLDSRNQEL